MSNLTPKDTTFSWEAPRSTHTRNATENNLVLLKRMVAAEHGTKWTSRLIDFKNPVLLKYFKEDEKEFKVGLAFEKERLIIVFNPPSGIVPFILSKNGNARAINNSHLIEKIYEYFKLDKSKSKYYLKIHYWTEINAMKLHVITPQHYDTKLPIFEDEINGTLEALKQ